MRHAGFGGTSSRARSGDKHPATTCIGGGMWRWRVRVVLLRPRAQLLAAGAQLSPL